MADDNIDFRFLGRQVQKLQGDVRELQGDVRDLRAGHLRLEGDVVGLRADLSRLEGAIDARFNALETRLEGFERSVDAHFQQMAETAATNLQIMLKAIGK